jgi:hypothetical protein
MQSAIYPSSELSENLRLVNYQEKMKLCMHLAVNKIQHDVQKLVDNCFIILLDLPMSPIINSRSIRTLANL